MRPYAQLAATDQASAGLLTMLGGKLSLVWAWQARLKLIRAAKIAPWQRRHKQTMASDRAANNIQNTDNDFKRFSRQIDSPWRKWTNLLLKIKYKKTLQTERIYTNLLLHLTFLARLLQIVGYENAQFAYQTSREAEKKIPFASYG